MLVTTATAALAAGCFAAPPALSQSAPAPTSDTAVQEVVVTGSILRHKLSDTDAPLTVLSAGDLTDRGITTIEEGLQDLSANGSSNLPNSFTANGAFAAGASGVSLRGLTTNSTLVLIDGLRTAYYPLADDGTRNFVDLNTIPDVIVDRIETLKDGASSTYGADAIAGVVNVITKRTYQGLMMKAEGGLSQQGGGAENNFQVLAGT
jgi:iron complex outermembrane receptor protein